MMHAKLWTEVLKFVVIGSNFEPKHLCAAFHKPRPFAVIGYTVEIRLWLWSISQSQYRWRVGDGRGVCLWRRGEFSPGWGGRSHGRNGLLQLALDLTVNDRASLSGLGIES